MANKEQHKGIKNLKPIQSGEVRNPYGSKGKNGRNVQEIAKMIKQVITKEQFQEQIKTLHLAIVEDKNMKAVEILWGYVYGKPLSMNGETVTEKHSLTLIQNNFKQVVDDSTLDDLIRMQNEIEEQSNSFTDYETE